MSRRTEFSRVKVVGMKFETCLLPRIIGNHIGAEALIGVIFSGLALRDKNFFDGPRLTEFYNRSTSLLYYNSGTRLEDVPELW